MPKKNRPISVKLIANPGAGNVREAASSIEQVTCYLMDAGLKVDMALAKPKKKPSPLQERPSKMARMS